MEIEGRAKVYIEKIVNSYKVKSHEDPIVDRKEHWTGSPVLALPVI